MDFLSLDLLACPQCVQPLDLSESGYQCVACDMQFPLSEEGPPDFRLQKPKPSSYSYEISPAYSEPTRQGPLQINPKCQFDLATLDIPARLTIELVSYFPAVHASPLHVLDLGCGSTAHKDLLCKMGYEYCGVDFHVADGNALADAQALPFSSNKFDFVLSISMLQYPAHPYAAISEAHRVLKPGGVFIGTVPFLEPYSGGHYHMSHAGIHRLLVDGGFEVVELAPSRTWTLLIAQSSMGLFPMMPVFLARLLVQPLDLMHRLWWKVGSLLNPKADEITRLTKTTGSFSFVAIALDTSKDRL